MNKCKGCQWYNKPYWSIINLCENCPREGTNVEILTRWQEPTIKEMQQEIDRLNNIINDTKEYLKHQINELDFEKDTKAKMLGAIILVMLDENNQELKGGNK